MKKSVLIYLPDLDKSSGGVLSFLQTLTKEMGRDLDIHIVTCHTDDEMTADNCNIHYLSVRKIPTLRTKREFLSILNEIHPDVFHTNSCWIPTSALTAIWAHEAGYKVIYTPHGMMEPWIMKRHYWTKKLPAMLLYQRRALRCADIIHTTSDSETEHLKALGFDNKYFVIPNSIDLADISVKTSWKRGNKILYLGRIHEKKGIQHILEAVKDLHDLLTGYKVDIVGDEDVETPDYRAKLIDMATQMSITDIVSFHDGRYGDDKWNALKNADILVLPTYSENFGIVIAEALSVGTPVITTDGAPWAEVRNRNCGWYVKTGKEALVNALKEYMTCTEEALETMGRNGRKLIEDNYELSIVKKKYHELYTHTNDI